MRQPERDDSATPIAGKHFLPPDNYAIWISGLTSQASNTFRRAYCEFYGAGRMLRAAPAKLPIALKLGASTAKLATGRHEPRVSVAPRFLDDSFYDWLLKFRCAAEKGSRWSSFSSG